MKVTNNICFCRRSQGDYKQDYFQGPTSNNIIFLIILISILKRVGVIGDEAGCGAGDSNGTGIGNEAGYGLNMELEMGLSMGIGCGWDWGCG